MENVLIDIRNENEQIRGMFKNKDLVSVEDLLDKLCSLDDDVKYIEEQYENYKKYVQEFYVWKGGS